MLCAIGLFTPKLIFSLFAEPRILAINEVSQTKVAIVFGAGLLRDGSAGPVLADRVQTAVNLYQQGKVEKLLMSGDNRFVEYNEPEAMRQYALERGVPDEDIVLDYAGRRTYDTCYRAKYIFQVNTAILVTQEFHMARALVLCNWFDVESVGVESNNRYFLKRHRAYWHFRELFATFQAMLDVLITKPMPVLGEVEPIE
ncbi:MAG: vancomycin high temperature exclusion protein [Chloroflexi bacterium OLB14]|nr:MAG: vancomycin high temperature exclusion protein [Chloroflexi bacterium OLB14]